MGLVLAVGCVWTDYSTVGYSLLLKPEKVWEVWDMWERSMRPELLCYLYFCFSVHLVGLLQCCAAYVFHNTAVRTP